MNFSIKDLQILLINDKIKNDNMLTKEVTVKRFLQRDFPSRAESGKLKSDSEVPFRVAGLNSVIVGSDG